MSEVDCNLLAQGFHQGACGVKTKEGGLRACEATLRERDGTVERLIHSVHLSRPENYLSIYQSGCNMSCRKCHSSEFSQRADGVWMSADKIVEYAVEYDRHVTVWEPRERATAWHAHDSCRCCGACLFEGSRPDSCPRVLEPGQIVLSPQGFGPARNIVAFTGGDVTCRPEFYARCARGIKEQTRQWVLIETNGYGLTPATVDLLSESGVDAFWLDIKAFDPVQHEWLTGCHNERILQLPEELVAKGFVLEVLSLCIPGVVEANDLGEIARILADVDRSIPFTILAFFPQYRMMDTPAPTVDQMIAAYEEARGAGLTDVRVGNLGVFLKSKRDLKILEAEVDPGAY